jgi:hypothetical protein
VLKTRTGELKSYRFGIGDLAAARPECWLQV